MCHWPRTDGLAAACSSDTAVTVGGDDGRTLMQGQPDRELMSHQALPRAVKRCGSSRSLGDQDLARLPAEIVRNMCFSTRAIWCALARLNRPSSTDRLPLTFNTGALICSYVTLHTPERVVVSFALLLPILRTYGAAQA
jgi:hypothetical protein